MISLRPYQVESVQLLREGVRNGHRSQLLVAPTGAGKTVVATHLMAGAAAKGTPTAFVVDRVALLDQASATLDQYGIDHGCVQAGHWRYRPNEKIQVCSAQTLEKRGFFPGMRLMIVDEAHTVRRQTAEAIKNLSNVTVLGLTATPFTKGLKDLYSNIVNVATTDMLIADGFLAPIKVYASKAPDMTGAKVVAGEWSDQEAADRGLKIIGDVVQEWVDKTTLHFGGPVKTIAFSATVDHGAAICEAFQAAGYDFRQVSYRDGNDDARRELIKEFKKPDTSIVGLVSVDALAKGFDVSDILCGIDARPLRKSLSTHIQKIGRVMRSHPGKEFALWLDHANNYLRFYGDTIRMFEHGAKSLDDTDLDAKARKEPTEKEVSQIKCSACGHILPPRAPACPVCGHERPRRNLVENIPGQLVLINGKSVPATGKHAYLANRTDVWRQLCYMAANRKPDDPDAARRWAQANYRKLYGEFAHRKYENTDPMTPRPELIGKIRSEQIRWARRAA